MISLFQTTGILARVVAFVRSLISRVVVFFRGLLGGGNAPTPPTPPTIPVEIIEETSAVITPFRLAVAVLIALIAIFAVMVAFQNMNERKMKKEAFAQGTFSHAEGRGCVEKTAQNEDKPTQEAGK